MAIDDNTSYELTGAQVKDLANKIKAKAADNIFVGATSAAPGSKGLVPQPQAGDNTKYLRGDGTWATPSGSGNAETIIYGFPSNSSQTFATAYIYPAGAIPQVQFYANQDKTTQLSFDNILTMMQSSPVRVVMMNPTGSSYEMFCRSEELKLSHNGYQIEFDVIFPLAVQVSSAYQVFDGAPTAKVAFYLSGGGQSAFAVSKEASSILTLIAPSDTFNFTSPSFTGYWYLSEASAARGTSSSITSSLPLILLAAADMGARIIFKRCSIQSYTVIPVSSHTASESNCAYSQYGEPTTGYIETFSFIDGKKMAITVTTQGVSAVVASL